MTFDQVLEKLREFGTESQKQIYKRHGAPEPLFGVSLSNIKKLKRQIKKNHQLAIQLWDYKVVDAKVLAALIADSKQITYSQCIDWINQSNYYILTDILINHLVFKTSYAQRIMHEIILSKDEYVGRAGWKLLENFASQNNTLSDAYFIPYLQCIQAEIHNFPNRIKEAMNHALIAIGCRNNNLESISLKVADEIGKVCVDHGKTSCKTPRAQDYIGNCRERKMQRKLHLNGVANIPTK